MQIEKCVTLVSGGASGLGLATARRLVSEGGRIVILDLPTSAGEQIAAGLGDAATFVAGDVTSEEDVARAVDVAGSLGDLRALVHTAGMGVSVRVIEKDGSPGSLETFRKVVDIDLTGSFNVLRLAAAAMNANEPIEGERGACVLTASIAGYEGQIGQIPYASAKAGVIGMTIVAARDLARTGIRVCTIAPGLMDTPMMASLRDDIRAGLAASVPNPSRLGHADEYADLAVTILRNRYLNGETIRLDGALRMGVR